MFKNLKIGKKLIISFIVISIIASISGIISVSTMKSINTKYSSALINYGFAQGDLGKLMSNLSRLNGSVHDAISYLNKSNLEAAKKDFEERSEDMVEYFDAVEKTLQVQENKDIFINTRETWKQYVKKANELLQESDTTDAETVRTLQERIVKELDPIYDKVYDTIINIMEIKVETGKTISMQMDTYSITAILISSILIAVSVIASIIFGVFISRAITKPIELCADRIHKLSQGDLKSKVPVITSKDETFILANATDSIVTSLNSIINDLVISLETMGGGDFSVESSVPELYIGDFVPIINFMKKIKERLSNTLLQISQSAEQVSTGSEQVSAGAQALSQGSTEQSSSIQQLAATINEVSEKINNNAQDADKASVEVNFVGQKINQCNVQMHEMIEAMTDIRGKSQEINKIIKTIEDIAFQTNILALNAAVEAARAGEAGKGFAVVADEVRNLASKSGEAANDTTVLIESTIEAISKGTNLTDATAESLSSVVASSKSVIGLIDQIAKVSAEQADSVSQISSGVEQISSVVQTNSATAEESASSSEELSCQAQILKNLVEEFILDESVTRNFNKNKMSDNSFNSQLIYK